MAADLTTVHVSSLGARCFWIDEDFVLVSSRVLRRTLMKHQPRAGKTGVWSSNYYYLFFTRSFHCSNLFHCGDVTFSFQKIIRSNDGLFPLRRFSERRKPVEELWMDNLLPTICNHDILSSEIKSLFRFWNPYLRRAYVLEKNFSSDCRGILFVWAHHHKVCFCNFN